MNPIARLAVTGLGVTCLGIGAAPAANKPDPKSAWPKHSRFTCRGVLSEDQGTLMLAPDQTMLTWCNAEIDDKDRRRILQVCNLGDRCQIKGTISGHGTFGWVAIHSIARPISPQ